MKRILAIALATVLAGCASHKVVQEDNTPKNPTAVLRSSGSINGQILPENTFNHIIYTRAKAQRMDYQRHFEGWVARMVLGDSDTSDITRLDKNLAWQIDRKKERYTECPLKGCTPYSEQIKQDSKDNQEANQDPLAREPGCVTTLMKNEFGVKATGQRRQVNGFNSEEYVASWKIVMQDKAGNKNTDDISMIFWTTQPTADMREAWKVQEEFYRGYLKQIGMPASPFGQFLGEDVQMALMAFASSFSKEDKQWVTRVAREFSKIKGYPVSTKFEWVHGGKACQPAEQPKEKKKSGFSGGLSGIISGVTDHVVDKKAEQMKKDYEASPVMRFVHEIHSVKMEMVNDGAFDVPRGFRIENRK